MTRPWRLLFLAPAACGGGAEAALEDLLAALHAARPGWELRVLALADGPLLERVRSRLGPGAAAVLPVPEALRKVGEAGGWMAKVRAGLAGAGVVRALRRELRAWRPDLVHSNGMKTHLLAGVALRLPRPGGFPRGLPLVWHFHDYPGTRRAVLPLLRGLARRCDGALAVSESVAGDVRRVFGGTFPTCMTHNAVDLERFTPEGPALDLDGLAGLPPAAPGTVRVGLVATFAHWKGHETFLRAAASVLRESPAPPVRFYVVGGPIYATAGSQRTGDELRAAARAAGLGETDVGFTGFVDDAPAAMRALDVVVHASTQPEPFGLVLAQAMACGRALVTSGLGGAAEIVTPETDALVHQAGDADSLAAAILRLAADAGLRARLGAAGRAGSKRFSRERLAEKVVPLYEGLMAGR